MKITLITILVSIFNINTTTLPENITPHRAEMYQEAHIDLCSNLIHTNYDRFQEVWCDLEETNNLIMKVKQWK